MLSRYRITVLLFVVFLTSMNIWSTALPDTLWNQTDENGLKQGWWKKQYPNGLLMYRGYFRNNKPEGEMTRYYEDGKKRAKLLHIKGGEITYAEFFFKNGQKGASGKYIRQKKDSIWSYYSYYTGAISYKESYKMGLRDGPATKFYPKGAKAEVINWKDDKKHGSWEQYYEDSTLRLNSQHVMDKIHGTYQIYNQNKILILDGSFKNGSQDGEWRYYDQEGVLLHNLSYSEGELLDKEKHEALVRELMDDIDKKIGKIPEPDFDNFFERNP